MFVSLPGTIVIFTQVSGFAALKASTMDCRPSESGGVCSVQKSTTAASAAQAAPPAAAAGDSSWAVAIEVPTALEARAIVAAATSQRGTLEREDMFLLLR